MDASVNKALPRVGIDRKSPQPKLIKGAPSAEFGRIFAVIQENKQNLPIFPEGGCHVSHQFPIQMVAGGVAQDNTNGKSANNPISKVIR